ncbi:MAG: hypothetical protein ACI4ST_03820, partial [Candidatus Gallimonas sp.]
NELLHCVGSKPNYYVSLTSSVAHDGEKLKGAIKFLNFLSSDEGQRISGVNGGADGKLSYVGGKKYSQSAFSGIAASLNEGKVFICDYFYTLFEDNVGLLKGFLQNEISVDQLIELMDEYMLELHVRPQTYSVESDFDYDGERVGQEETAIGDFLVDRVREAAGVEVCLIPSAAIVGNILKGDITEAEFCALFQDGKYVYANVTVGGIKRYAESAEELVLLSGVVFGPDGCLYRNGVKLDENKAMYVLLPEAAVEELGEHVIKTGYTRNLHSFLSDLIGGITIQPPVKDGRYDYLSAVRNHR